MVVDQSEQDTASNTSNTPGGQQDTVQTRDVVHAKEIVNKRGDGTESASVGAGQRPDGQEESPVVLGDKDEGQDRKNDDLGAQHDQIRGLSTNHIRQRREHQTTDKVEATIDSNDSRGCISALVKDVDTHVSKTGQDHQTRDQVGQEHHVHAQVLVRAQGLAKSQVNGGLKYDAVLGGRLGVGNDGRHRLFILSRAGLLLLAGDEESAISVYGATDLGALGWREPEDEGTEHEDNPVTGSNDHKGQCQPNGVNQGQRNLRTNQTTNTES